MTKHQANFDSNLLLEPSFADAIRAIENAGDETLSATQRQYWPTSLRKMAQYIGRPPELIAARIMSVRQKIRSLHPNMLGVNEKTFANHRANVKAALNWFSKAANVPKRGAPMSAAWRELYDLIEDVHIKRFLSPFFRFLSSAEVDPDEVDNTHVEAYFVMRDNCTFMEQKLFDRRLLARQWNEMAGKYHKWPKVLFPVPPILRPADEIPEKDFPVALMASVESYLGQLSKKHRSINGKQWQACKQSTITTRRREILTSVRVAVKCGVDLNALQSLTDLCQPEVVEKIIDYYWRKSGEIPNTYTIDLAGKFRSIAHLATDLDDVAQERLKEICEELETYRKNGGLTEKNMKVVRMVLETELWSQVVGLPGQLLADAVAVHNCSPKKAAHLAETAVAIRLLTVAPIRLSNLMSIKLEENLIRPGGPARTWNLVFPGYDVKNNVPLEFPLYQETSELLDTYLQIYRPQIMHGRNHDFLFPGLRYDYKSRKSMGARISKTLNTRLGIVVTPHQFRHAAAAIILKNQPGNYELARRVLGHRNIQTTIRFYTGLGTLEANRQYGQMIVDMLPAKKRAG